MCVWHDPRYTTFRYGFNPGCTQGISTPITSAVVGRVSVTTTIAAGAGGLSALFYSRFSQGHFDLVAVCNGILCGLVSITSACACVEPWAALIIGACGALLFAKCDEFILNILKIDDPLAASAMHGGVGIFGSLMIGFFAKEEYLKQEFLIARLDDFEWPSSHSGKGILYGGDGRILACQIIGTLVNCGSLSNGEGSSSTCVVPLDSAGASAWTLLTM
jgi:ammonium transporter, Amt family